MHGTSGAAVSEADAHPCPVPKTFGAAVQISATLKPTKRGKHKLFGQIKVAPDQVILPSFNVMVYY